MVEGRQGAAREYIHGLPVPRIQGRLLLSRSWASWVSLGSLSSPCKQFPASFSLLLRLRQVSLALFLSPRPDVGLLGWLSSEGSACQGRRHKRCRFDQWAGKIPWRRRWQLTPVFLPGKSYEWSSLVGSSSWGHKSIRSNSAIEQQQQWIWPLACLWHPFALAVVPGPHVWLLPKATGFERCDCASLSLRWEQVCESLVGWSFPTHVNDVVSALGHLTAL